MNHYMLMREFGLEAKDQAFLTEEHLIRYLCLLHRILELDGINPAEKLFWDNARTYADLSKGAQEKLEASIGSDDTAESLLKAFGDEANSLLRRYIIRDAIRAALADDEYSPAEQELIGRIATKLEIPADAVGDVLAVVKEQKALAAKWDAIEW